MSRFQAALEKKKKKQLLDGIEAVVWAKRTETDSNKPDEVLTESTSSLEKPGLFLKRCVLPTTTGIPLNPRN